MYRIESDILKIKAEMDTLEGQLTGLMTKSENDSLHKSWKQLNIDKVLTK